MNIWLIGGTSESREIAQILTLHQLPLVISVTAPSARRLYDSLAPATVIVTDIKGATIADFLAEHRIEIVIDATHPFAVNISQKAIAACRSQNLPYLRYERPALADSHKNIITLGSIEHLLRSNYLAGKRVLLTIGCKSLPLFAHYHQQALLFARILPSSHSLAEAEKAGFQGDRLIALRPPLTVELERALWQSWQIEVVVTKASGKAGGEEIKRQVARELDIPLMVIQRPPLDYPQITSELAEVLQFCLHWQGNRR